MAKEGTQWIIILSGPVGAGKSTVAREIIKTSTDPLVYIEGDKFWLFFVKGFGSRSRFKNFKTIMSSMTAAAMPYALSGFNVLLDFTIPPWFLETAIKITSSRNVPLQYIVLMPDEKVCAERVANRQEGSIDNYALYHDLYVDFKDAKLYTIENNLSDAATIADEIRQGILNGSFRIHNDKL